MNILKRSPTYCLSLPKQSMYGIFPYIYHKNQPNVGKYTIHGWYGLYHPWFINDGNSDDFHADSITPPPINFLSPKLPTNFSQSMCRANLGRRFLVGCIFSGEDMHKQVSRKQKEWSSTSMDN